VPPAFDNYPHADLLNNIGAGAGGGGGGGTGSTGSGGSGGSSRKSAWQDFGRPSEEKVNIPKIYNPYGFR
jgi:hypothetical protein